jgi:hypothetical protein
LVVDIQGTDSEVLLARALHEMPRLYTIFPDLSNG